MGAPTGGTWTISDNAIGGATTAGIPYNATAQQVYDALDTLYEYSGAVDSVVAKEEGTFPADGGGYIITLSVAVYGREPDYAITSYLQGGAVSLTSPTTTEWTGAGAPIQLSFNCQGATYGIFTVDGISTPLNYNASDAEIIGYLPTNVTWESIGTSSTDVGTVTVRTTTNQSMESIGMGGTFTVTDNQTDGNPTSGVDDYGATGGSPVVTCTMTYEAAVVFQIIVAG